jgi:hypothetical protein
MKAIILKEGLKSWPNELDQFIRNSRLHSFSGGPKMVEVVEIEIDEAMIPSIAVKLSTYLLPKKYYCHFVDPNKLIVVFPMCLCLVSRENVAEAERCKTIGRMFEIPDRQMQFEKMFETDHPDAE